MSREIEISEHPSPIDGSTTMAVKIGPSELMREAMADGLLREIIEKVAERYVAEHYAEIAALLNQQAIANLAIADSGKKIAEEIRAKAPEPRIIREKETQIYQRGLLGGMRRVR